MSAFVVHNFHPPFYSLSRLSVVSRPGNLIMIQIAIPSAKMIPMAEQSHKHPVQRYEGMVEEQFKLQTPGFNIAKSLQFAISTNEVDVEKFAKDKFKRRVPACVQGMSLAQMQYPALFQSPFDWRITTDLPFSYALDIFGTDKIYNCTKMSILPTDLDDRFLCHLCITKDWGRDVQVWTAWEARLHMKIAHPGWKKFD
ncbi:hypothetical protein K439DRAFT_1657502 [Ramaria rubella]|nr:hypothetical protein K439DRAFT_1657502 [Ramaria rubella]